MKTKQMMAAAALAIGLAAPSAWARYGSAKEAAAHTMGQLPSLAGNGLKKVGLAQESAQKGTLGDPFAVYLVGFDTLQAYDGTATDRAMLRDIHQMIYPMLVDGSPTASLQVHLTPNGWETSQISSPEYLRRELAVRSSAMAAEKQPAGSYFLVKIPALELIFVASGKGDDLTFRSVEKIPEIGLEANTAISGKALFPKLAQLARAQQAGPQR